MFPDPRYPTVRAEGVSTSALEQTRGAFNPCGAPAGGASRPGRPAVCRYVHTRATRTQRERRPLSVLPWDDPCQVTVGACHCKHPSYPVAPRLCSPHFIPRGESRHWRRPRVGSSACLGPRPPAFPTASLDVPRRGGQGPDVWRGTHNAVGGTRVPRAGGVCHAQTQRQQRQRLAGGGLRRVTTGRWGCLTGGTVWTASAVATPAPAARAMRGGGVGNMPSSTAEGTLRCLLPYEQHTSPAHPRPLAHALSCTTY